MIMEMIGTSRLPWNWELCTKCLGGERDLTPWRWIGGGADPYREAGRNGSLGSATHPEMTAMLMLPEAVEEELLLGKANGGFAGDGVLSVAWGSDSDSFSEVFIFGGGDCNAGLVPGAGPAARASDACRRRASYPGSL